jgi:hypothetical protein
MEPGQVDQYLYQVKELIESGSEKKSSRIEVVIGNIQGEVIPKFYSCIVKTSSDYLNQCQMRERNMGNLVAMIAVRSESKDTEKKYWFEVEWADYNSKFGMVQVVHQGVVVVENGRKDGTSAYEIQYKNKGRMSLLREGETIKGRVLIGEKRDYKFPFTDQDIAEVRIHCTKISGEVLFHGSFGHPRENATLKILPHTGTIRFKMGSKVKEVFLQVVGVDNALYSTTTQVIRKSTVPQLNKSTSEIS